MKQIHFFTAVTLHYLQIVKLQCCCMKKYKNPNYTYVYHLMLDCEDLKPFQNYFKSIEDDTFKIDLLDTNNVINKINAPRNRAMVYVKPLTPILFPNIEKILWLDGDTLIVKSGIELLFEQDISDYFVMAAHDVCIQLLRKDELDNTKVQHYFNSGVMLLNLKKIREEGLDKQLEQDVLNYPLELNQEYEDQALLNYRFHQKVSWLHPRWNNCIFSITREDFKIYDQGYKNIGYKNILESVDDAVIFHWLGPSKPWWEDHFDINYLFLKPSMELFFSYVNMFNQQVTKERN